MTTWRGPLEELLEPGSSLVDEMIGIVGNKLQLTVTAGAVDLSDVGDGVVANSDSSLALVLDNLVGGILGTSTSDENVAIATSGDGIFSCDQYRYVFFEGVK